ncbi:hypothetical protein GC176_07950 [bacterium]|nr:hypothetical protein [bacterium]
MRKRYASKSIFSFDRWWQEFDPKSVGSYLLLLFMAPFLIAKLAVYLLLVVAIATELAVLPSAWWLLKRAFREAVAFGQTDDDSTRLKGGEARQTGSEWKGSLVRFGGPLSSDDLRRRLYELRTLKTERMSRRTPNVGGQNGKQ